MAGSLGVAANTTQKWLELIWVVLGLEIHFRFSSVQTLNWTGLSYPMPISSLLHMILRAFPILDYLQNFRKFKSRSV